MIAVVEYIFESWLWSILGLVVGYLLGKAEKAHLDKLDRLDEDIHHASEDRGNGDDHP